ncbi:ribonuclease Z [Tepidimicrobium xylanilyticum]|uniref:Ribonuclease Z n=1 Tax=Tepidimicrobium xylanilyticum TaxID=1123352 RepID=A0A1H2R9N9_9FIRM|nr:ribonuclease Z [Tepidimicrobium xylanilyticum]GMG95481.1 ribonuclease Z [Tepidimicrobium xylanilyticum]SDW16117.1 RNAse Z [Tepidimicrobium xylanilyticum]
MLDLALLGTGGSMPIPERFLSSLLIKYKGSKILVDCGEGTQVSLRLLKWGFKSIDMILITHWHGDHILGLPGLLTTIGNSGRRAPMMIIGPQGIKKIIEGLLASLSYLPYSIHLVEVSEISIVVSFNKHGLEIKEADESSQSYGDLIISTLELDHSSPCIGYSFYVPRRPKFNPEKAISNGVPKNLWKRLQQGETVIYEGMTIKPSMVLDDNREGIKLSFITDTRPIDTIPDFIEGSQLFICEGTYGDEQDRERAIKNKHMLFSEAARLAYEGKVKELLLTHFSPVMEEPEKHIENARRVFPQTTIGYDRLTIQLNYP